MEGGPKLVRDRIPEIIAADGATPQTSKVEGAAFVEALHKKLIEESNEVAAAEEGEVVGELADVYEVLVALAEAHGVHIDEVVDAADVKKQQRGGFAEGIILEDF